MLAREHVLQLSLEFGPFDERAMVSESDLCQAFSELATHHADNCGEYHLFLRTLKLNEPPTRLDEIPFLPARIFKERRLKSVRDEDVFRTLYSSGTTGSRSEIVLDSSSAALQAKVLSKSIQSGIGIGRVPMLIADHPGVTKMATARTAGVLGMMNLGRKHLFIVDDELRFREEEFNDWLIEYGGSPFLVFGFTYMVWTYLYENARHLGPRMGNGVVVHSGGWKQLVDRSVSNDDFKAQMKSDLGISRVFNFYGMVEQIGSIFLESEDDLPGLRVPSFCSVLIRDPLSLEVVPDGRVGLIQVLSLLPTSYPGFSILTEDLGYVTGFGVDRRLVVEGRLPRSELRGCSDVYKGS